MVLKRYNIINQYIRGSNVSPQTSHALNNLWKSCRSMSVNARNLFEEWAFNSEFEIDLQGGGHGALEEIYEALQCLSSIPSAKFNESEEALNGACTVVTFVATPRIVAINDWIRLNGFKGWGVEELMEQLKKESAFGDMEKDVNTDNSITKEEIFIASYLSRLSTVS